MINQKIRLTLGIFFVIILSSIVLSLDVFVFSPNDNYLDINGNVSDSGNSFICSVQASVNTNVSNVTFWNNHTGVWKRNLTNSSGFGAENNGTLWRNVTFVLPTNFSDGFSFVWACEVCVNGTNSEGNDWCSNSTWQKFTTNRSVRVEYAPNVTIQNPLPYSNISTKTPTLNFSVSSLYIRSGRPNYNVFDCNIWDNSNGTWQETPLGITVINSTTENTTTYPHEFNETKNFVWNMKCCERNDPLVCAFSVSNFTLTVDVTNPKVTLNSPADESYDKDGNVEFNYTPVDNTLVNCSISHNASNAYILNATNASVITSTDGLSAQKINTEGKIVWAVSCLDRVNHTTWTANRTLYIDTTATLMKNTTNYTVPNTCTQVGITWNTTEARNGSLRYGKTPEVSMNTTANSDFALVHSANITFGNNVETLYYYNITSCDAANNCNSTNGTVITPLGLCNEGGNNAGWSAFSILSNAETLGTVANNSGATYAYMWNQTTQAWIYNQKATSSNAATSVPYGTAVLLYSATNLTWFRNTTVTGHYKFNLTTGDNFFGLTTDYTFGNLTRSFLNATYRGENLTTGLANLTNNSIYFATFNNSIHGYVNHYSSFSWENTTVLPRGSIIWNWVDVFNLTWNGTAISENQSLIYTTS